MDDVTRDARLARYGAPTGDGTPFVDRHRPSLSPGDAAAALGVGPAVIRDAISSRELAAEYHAGHWRIAVNDLVRFARRRNLPLPLVPWERDSTLPVLPDAANLPAARNALVGRTEDVARVVALLEDRAFTLITLTGPGGIGKTRLALAIAEAMRERAGGACFVDLSAVMQADEVVPAIAQSLGLREIAGQDQLRQIADFLHARGVFLVVDNVEQVIDAAPHIAEIGRLARTTILVTSRARLRVAGEREFPVTSLAWAGSEATPEDLLASDAGRLFVERAKAHDPAFAVTEQNAPAIAQICARLDGLPLAIELAAARTRLLSPRQLRDRLASTLPLLTSGERDAPPRHTTMRDAIAWSYDLLAPDEQRLFRQLSIFSGGFSLDAIEWVGSSLASHAPEPITLDRLDALLDQGLVAREIGLDGEPHYRLLETIRAFGLEQLTGEEETVFRDLHAEYFRELTLSLQPIVFTQSARAPLERLATDDANVRVALTRLADRGALAEFGAMVAALSGYWLAYSLLGEADSWITRAMACRDHLTLADQARLLNARAIFSSFMGDLEQADEAFAEGLPLSRLAGSELDVAMALTSFGALHNVRARYAAAEQALDEGLTFAAAVSDPAGRAALMGRALANLSVTARSQDDLARARALSEAALGWYRGFGFDLAETRTLMDLADIARFEGDLEGMVTHYQSCLARTGERGDMRLVADALMGIASACTDWRQLQTAVLLFGAAEALRERVGLRFVLPLDSAMTDASLAQLRNALGDTAFEDGLREGRALPIVRAIGIALAVSSMTEQGEPVQPVAPLLTRREQDVLRLLTAGHTDREIAESLYIGHRTASWHVGAILAKLGVKTRREAATQAVEDGLV